MSDGFRNSGPGNPRNHGDASHPESGLRGPDRCFRQPSRPSGQASGDGLAHRDSHRARDAADDNSFDGSSPTTGRDGWPLRNGDRREAQAARQHDGAAGECRDGQRHGERERRGRRARGRRGSVATIAATARAAASIADRPPPRRATRLEGRPPKRQAGWADGSSSPLTDADHRRRPAEGADAAGGDRLGDARRAGDCPRPATGPGTPGRGQVVGQPGRADRLEHGSRPWRSIDEIPVGGRSRAPPRIRPDRGPPLARRGGPARG